MYKTIISIMLVVLFCYQLTAQNISSEQLEKHVTYLASDELLGRGFGSEEGNIARNYIADQFKEAGVKPLLDDYYHRFIQRHGILNIKGANVVGVIEGNNPVMKDEYIVLGAHYDHLGWKVEEGDTIAYNGADDNASGIASIIEIGRSLVANRENLKRSVVLIAFDGEESGLYGSKRFVKDSILLPEQIKVMFSLDMVGMYEKHEGLDMKGLGSIKNGDEIAEMIREDVPITIKKSEYPGLPIPHLLVMPGYQPYMPLPGRNLLITNPRMTVTCSTMKGWQKSVISCMLLPRNYRMPLKSRL
jgi:aminopeptidase YwaD